MPNEKDIRVGIAVHSYGPIPPEVYANHVGVFAMWGKMCNVKFLHIDGVKTAEARNMLVEKAIEEDCTHILFLDADHIVTSDLLPCLLGNADSTVVSGLVVKRDGSSSQVGFINRDDGYFFNVLFPTDGLSYEVDACGFGCTLIDLSIFKDIDEPYFKDVMYRDPEGKLRQRRSDMEFCREVKALGKDIRIDTRAKIGHLGVSTIHYPEERQYQLHTYKVAEEIAKNMVNPTAIDFGCGFAKKLVEIVEPLCRSVVGVDKKQIIDDCKRAYPESKTKWGVADLENSIENCGKFDLVICADVLEHLSHPEALVHTIANHLNNDGYAVISTPDVRTIAPGIKMNPEHKQFWDESQFVCLLEGGGLKVNELKMEKEVTDYISMIAICRR